MTDTPAIELKTSELAKRLNLAESTVRKYAQELEKSGYVFERDEAGARIFRRRDIDAFTTLKKIREETHVGVEQAALMVAASISKDDPEPKTTPKNQADPPTEIIVQERLEARIVSAEALDQLQQTFLQIAAAQERIFHELIESRQREAELMNEVKELKHQLELIQKETTAITDRERIQSIDEKMAMIAQLQEQKKRKKRLGLF